MRRRGPQGAVSLATVYNTLHQFTEVGLLREVAVEGAKTYFDTNTSNHYHFFCENSGKLMDIETGSIRIEGCPRRPRAWPSRGSMCWCASSTSANAVAGYFTSSPR